jgi:hypothetical protein
LSNRTSVTTYQLNTKKAFTKELLPDGGPYVRYRDEQGKLRQHKNYLSVANLTIVDYPGYTRAYPASIQFLSSEYSPYTFALKNADFYRLKVLSNDVSGNLSVNNLVAKDISGSNINIDDVINTDIYEDNSKMVSFPSKVQFGDDVTFKNSIQTSSITSEDGLFNDISSDVITCSNSLYSNYIECNNITIGGVSLNSTQLNKLLALIS